MDNLFCKSLPTLQFVKSSLDQILDVYLVFRRKNDECDFDYHELNINQPNDLQIWMLTLLLSVIIHKIRLKTDTQSG